MTVESSTNRVSYTGSGTVGPFAVPFYFLEDDDLVVIRTTIATGTEVVLTLTTDYTVSGAADPDGGSVTLTSVLASIYALVIVRDPDRLQATSYPRNDAFPAATHERALDKLTMLVQRSRDLFERAFRLSDGDVSGVNLEISESASSRANKYLGFDSNGNLTLSQALDVGETVISSFMETVLDDTDAETARGTLAAASIGANTFTGVQRWAKGADVVSANALALGTDGNYFDITGTTAITSIGTLGAGTVVKLHFDAALTLTHHATDLILPGGDNITTAAGDEAEFVEYATGLWRCTNYVPAAFVPAVIGQAEAEAGTDTSPRLWTAERVAQAIAALAASGGSLPKNYITGLTLSNNASDATNDIDIAAGKARDATDTEGMVLASALTKQIDAAWAVGTNAGMLDTGAVGNNTYHLFLIKRSDTGVVDVLASLSAMNSGTCTMTIASPGVVTFVKHGLQIGSSFEFSSTGDLPTGVTAGTTYYVITTGFGVDSFQFSASQGGAAVNTSGTQSGTHTLTHKPIMPANYDYKRRIGSILRTGAANVGFIQSGQEFTRKVPINSVNQTTPGTSAATRTLNVPVGIKCRAVIGCGNESQSNTVVPTYVLVTDLDTTDTVPSTTVFSYKVGPYLTIDADVNAGGSMLNVVTNYAAQVRSRQSSGNTSDTFAITTIGYEDYQLSEGL